MGLSLSELEELTPRELNFALKDASKREEDYYKTQWETMRLQTMILFNPSLKEGHQYKSPKKFMPFPWDEGVKWQNPEDVKKQSVEEMKAVMMEIASSNNKKKRDE